MKFIESNEHAITEARRIGKARSEAMEYLLIGFFIGVVVGALITA